MRGCLSATSQADGQKVTRHHRQDAARILGQRSRRPHRHERDRGAAGGTRTGRRRRARRRRAWRISPRSRAAARASCAGGVEVIDEVLQRQSGLHGGRHRAALEGSTTARRPPHRRARRHAASSVRDAPSLHKALARNLAAARADLVFLCGPKMRALWDALPAKSRGAYAETSSELAPEMMRALQDRRRRAGQRIVRKPHVGRHRRAARARSRRGIGGEECSIIFWCRFRTRSPVFNVFRYLTFRTGGAVLTALLISFIIGPA